MNIQKSFDLTYCSNIHPGEKWEDHFCHLKKVVPELKEKLCPNGKFGLGLRIGNQYVMDLFRDGSINIFKEWLNQNDLYVFTINGFPFGSFHGQIVKEEVHQPDWTTVERVDYTKNLFLLLKELVEVGQEGSISTSPLGYKFNFSQEERKNWALEISARNLVEIAMLLRDLKKAGYLFHLDLEPEPDGLLENSLEVIDFFNNYLIPIAKKQLQASREYVEELIFDHIRVCFDICHFAVVYENQLTAMENFRTAGIKIGKIQISSALEIEFKNGEVSEKLNKLLEFNESVYLHQVAIKTNSEEYFRFKDLGELKLETVPDGTQELRSHFHVPIFMDKFENLSSTQKEIIQLLEYIKKNNVCNHLEVETYTWGVLPSEYQIGLTSSIERELQWVISRLEA